MRYDLVDDVSRRNDVLVISGLERRYAAGVWTTPVEDSLRHARVECLNYAIGDLNTTWPDWALWLIAGHYPVQPDNRITRYYGLWKSLERGMSIPQGEGLGESVIKCEGGVRVFGAIRFDISQVEAVHSVMGLDSGRDPLHG